MPLTAQQIVALTPSAGATRRVPLQWAALAAWIAMTSLGRHPMPAGAHGDATLPKLTGAR